METKELFDYINKQIADGFTKEQISKTLSGIGWSTIDIENAFESIPTKLDKQQILVQSRKMPGAEPPVSEPESETHQDISTMEQPKQYVEQTSSQENVMPDILNHNGETHTSKKIWVAISVVIFSILIGTGGAYAYFSHFKKLTPYEVLAQMIEASQYTGPSKFETSFSINTQSSSSGNKNNNIDIEINTKGNKDTSNIKNIKMDSKINIKADATATGFGGINLTLNADIKILDNIIYIRLNKSSGFPAYMNMNNITGKWIKYDPLTIENMSGKVIENNQYLDKVLRIKKDQQKKLISDMLGFLVEIKPIINRSFLEKPNEKINNIPVYHYVVKLSSDDINTLFDKFIEIATKPSAYGSVIDMSTVDKFKKSQNFKHMVNILTKSDFQIWIGKKDFLPYKVVTKVNLNNDKFIDTSEERNKKASILTNFASIMPEAELFYYNNKNSYGNSFRLGSCPVSATTNTIFVQDKNIAKDIQKIKDAGALDVSCVAVNNSPGTSKYAISAVFADGSGGWCIDNTFSGSGTANKDGKCGKYIPNTTTTNTSGLNHFITVNGSISSTYSASDYGKPVTIEVPQDAIPIKDAMKVLQR